MSRCFMNVRNLHTGCLNNEKFFHYWVNVFFALSDDKKYTANNIWIKIPKITFGVEYIDSIKPPIVISVNVCVISFANSKFIEKPIAKPTIDEQQYAIGK